VDYRTKQEFCDAEARHAHWPEVRGMWLQIRDSYRHLADREERAEREELERPQCF
jgi:hypothetical protein